MSESGIHLTYIQCESRLDNQSELQSTSLRTASSTLEEVKPASGYTADLLAPLLKREVGSILIKGEPGAGKTTLALELLSMHGSGVYISTRVSLEQLISHQKELSRLLKEGKIIDVSADKLHPKKDNSQFLDSRFADPKEFLKVLLDAILKVQEPLIVLDSWDSIANLTERVERLKIEQGINFIAAGHKAKVIFLSEDPNMTTTDYLVDAVVTMRNERFDGNRVRTIEWNKLRGSAISLSTNIYTLADGRFTAIPPSDILRLPPTAAKPYSPLPHQETQYSTGSADLDNFFEGGLPKSRHIMFELGRYSSSFECFTPITSTVSMNFIANGGSAILVPSSGSAGTQLKALNSHLPSKDVRERFRVGSFGKPVDSGSCQFEMDPCSWESSCDMILDISQSIRASSGNPCMYAISADVVNHVFDHSDAARFMQRIVHKIRHSEDVLLSVVTFGSSLTNELGGMADIYVRFEQVEGALVIHSVKPRSQLYSVSNDFSKGYLETRLTSLV